MPSLSEYLRTLSWLFKTRCNYSPNLRHKPGIGRLNQITQVFNSAQHQRFAQLDTQYDLSDWPRLCDQSEYKENLYILDLLDRYLSSVPIHYPGLDIGCRNFSHLPALHTFSQHPWHGVELDAHARYWNGYTRHAYGQWMASQYKECRYIADSLLNIEGRYSFIYWVLPFVSPAPLAYWGLPARFFQPEDLLQKAWNLLDTEGIMLIINQGGTEAETQKALFEKVAIKAQSIGEISSLFSPFQIKRYGWIIEKSSAD